MTVSVLPKRSISVLTTNTFRFSRYDIDPNPTTPDEYIYPYVPAEITENVDSKFNVVDSVMGRASAIIGWQSVGAHTLGIAIQLAEDSTIDRTMSVYDRVQWFRSFTLPIFRGGKNGDGFPKLPPPRIQVTFGNFINHIGVVNPFEVTWKAPYGVDGRPMFASFSLSIVEAMGPRFGGGRTRNAVTR